MKTGNKRNHNLPILLSVITIIFTTMACSAQPPSTGETPEDPTGQGAAAETSAPQVEITCFAGITPGQTTRDEVITLLGEPAASEKSDSDEILLYSSPLAGQFNTVIIENQVVVFASVILDESNLALSSLKAQYGEPDRIDYSTYASGSRTYSYPEKGQAFIGDENFDVVYVKQCFTPTTLENYMSRWGRDLPTEDPFTE